MISKIIRSRYFLILFLFFSSMSLVGQTSDDENSSKQIVDLDESATMEDFQNQGKVEVAKEIREKRKVSVNFNFGNIQFYDWKRAVNFYTEYFAWYPEILRALNISILPSGIKNQGITINGIDFFGFESSVNLKWGGGVEAFYFDRGKDGRAFIYGHDDGLWNKQDFLNMSGLNFISKGYDKAYAHWGLGWNINFKVDKKNDISFGLGYDGKFTKYLDDGRIESEQWLKGLSDPTSKMYTPDRDMSILNKVSLDFRFSHRTDIQQKFTHGLFNEIGFGIKGEIAPDFLNPSITGEYLPKKSNDGLFEKDEAGNLLYDARKQYTADYFKIEANFFARRKLFDIAPDRKSVLFAGYVRMGSAIRYYDRLGYVGYIPLEIRGGGWERQAYGTNSLDLILQLPQVKVEDLKGWSTPKMNSDWGKVEDWFGGVVSKLGVKPNYAAWNNVNVIEPELRLQIANHWSRDTDDGLSSRVQQLFIDSREYNIIDFTIDLNIRVFDFLNLGLVFEFQLEKPRWDYFWFRLG